MEAVSSLYSALPIVGKKQSAVLNGTLHPDFLPVANVLRGQLRNSRGGAAVCVFHRGECVVDLWGGFKDESGTPWVRDTMAPSFSTTKGVASTILHILRDRRLLDYDQSVASIWPEFGQSGKQHITVRQVLSHSAGLYHIREMIDDARRMLDWDYMVRAIERSAPVHEPGTRTGYHGLTYGFLVGEIAQRVTGKSFQDLVREEIAEPLGLDGCYVGAPATEIHRAAQLIWPSANRLADWLPIASLGIGVDSGAKLLRGVLRSTGWQVDPGSLLNALGPRGIANFDFGSSETLQAVIPAGGGLFTARSLARMYAALASGGELDGVRLLSRTTLMRATAPQRKPRGRSVLPIDMRWRLGYHGVFTTRGVPKHAFGHFGFGGSGAWADPQRQLSVAMVVNSGMGTPFGDARIARLSTAALASRPE